MKKSLLTVVTLFILFPGFAQSNDSAAIKKIFDEILTHSSAYTNLTKLCKEVGPRLSGSQQFSRAVNVVTKMMKDAGADTVFLQECMIPHWIRGEKKPVSLLYKGRKIMA